MMIKNVNADLCLIKEKIIKTDEVIRLLLEKKQENQKLLSKYHVLLNVYTKKCKEETVVQQKISLLEQKLEDHQLTLKKYEELECAYEEIKNTHSKYANEILMKYQNANKEITDLTAQLESKSVLKLKEQCSKACISKTAKLEKKISNLEEKEKNQTELVTFLEKENKELIKKNKHSENRNVINENKKKQAESYVALVSFIKDRIKNDSFNSSSDIYHLLDNYIEEKNSYKQKLLDIERNYDILEKEKYFLKDQLNSLKVKLDQKIELEKRKLKTCSVAIQTEELVCDENNFENYHFSNDENSEFIHQIEDEVNDSDSDSSIGFIFKELALPKAVSPLSILSDLEENSVEHFNDLEMVENVQTNLPIITIIPPTPPLQEIEHNFENISTQCSFKCKNCNIYKKKTLNVHKKLRDNKNRVNKLYKTNLRFKNILRKQKMRKKLSQTSQKALKQLQGSCVLNNFEKEDKYCTGVLCKAYSYCFDYTRPSSPDFIGFKEIKKSLQPQKEILENQNVSNNTANLQDNCKSTFVNSEKVDKSCNTHSITLPVHEDLELLDKPKPKDIETKSEDPYSTLFKVFEKMIVYIDKKIDSCTLPLNSNFEKQNKIISADEERNFNQLLAKYKRNQIGNVERRQSSSSESLPPSVKFRRPKKPRAIPDNWRKPAESDRSPSVTSLSEIEPASADSGYNSENRVETTNSINFNNILGDIQDVSSSDDEAKDRFVAIKEVKKTEKNVNEDKKRKLSKLEKLRTQLSNTRARRSNAMIRIDYSATQNKTKPNLEEKPDLKISSKQQKDKNPERTVKRKFNKEEETSLKKIADIEKDFEIKTNQSDTRVKRQKAAPILKSPVKVLPQKEEKPEKVGYKRPIRQRIIIECPRSPSPEPLQNTVPVNPKIIPLEKPKKLSKVAANEILQKLLNFPHEARIVEGVVNAFSSQEEDYIAEIILDKVSEDVHDQPDTKYSPPAPLLTPTQRILLGLLVALEKRNLPVIDKFLLRAEPKLLLEKKLLHLSPLLRLYLAICKMRKDRERMRRMCCDAVYFMGDLAVPFLFTVVTSWGDVIPMASESGDKPLLKASIKVIMQKNCTLPGYNFNNLKSLILEYYNYKELENIDEMFDNFFRKYKENPTWTLQYSILLLCKYSDKKWVVKKIENTVVPCICSVDHPKLLMAIFSLVQKICQIFSENYGDDEFENHMKDWISSFKKGTTSTTTTNTTI